MIAEKFKDQYPHVYDFVVHQLYVDDGTLSVDSVEFAYQLARDTCYVLFQGSFKVKHFIIGGRHEEITDDMLIQQNLPLEVRLGRETEIVLGMHWHTETDEMSLIT